MKENEWEKDVVVPVYVMVDQEAEASPDPGLGCNHRNSTSSD